ncbi:MAG TPA: dipeptidase [Verrucomicrobia bacterium]|nr:dipeptidase [Verrucomicrobiales bacterium]HIL55925.1 dipeptidase [Verrucomicrobiota bacterium]
MNEEHLEDLITYLKFPSISTDSAHSNDVKDCAEWLRNKMIDQGLESQIHETPGHPIVMGKNEHREGLPTIMIYGHYDVQPADPIDLWESSPFEPRIDDGKIYARGSTDNKGQNLAHLLGLGEIINEEGELPVNVILLVEGEEEIGSPNLGPFLEKYKDELECDVIAVSDTGMIGPGIGTFTYGLRGIACMEITVHGPSTDLHSGVFGGSIANPSTAIAKLISSLHDPDGKIKVAGFYDDVREIQEWERDSWAGLPVNEAETLELTGSSELFGENGFTDAERRWARPTAEVNGIGGGYQGEGSKTVIPSKSFAKLSFRLVPDQDPENILKLVREHLESHLIPGTRIECEFGHSGKAYLMDPQSAYGKAAQNALRETFGREPALIREGGSIPIVQTFKDVLGTDTLLLGLALPDCQIHAPNENFLIKNFYDGIRLNRLLIREISN